MPEHHFLEDILYPYMRETDSDRKRSTRESEASCSRRLEAFFKGYYLGVRQTSRNRALTGAVVRQYRERRKLEGVSPQTVKRELALASKAVNYAISEWDYDVDNPFRGRLMSRRDALALEVRAFRVLSAAEEARLLMAAEPLCRDVIVFALNTGLRQGEVLGLTWDQIDGDIVRFTPAQQKSGRHGARALNERALGVLARQEEVGEHVFHREGRRLNRHEFRTLWQKARAKAGLPDVRFHDLRKNLGQRLLEATGDIVAVQYQLGHADIRTTQRIYTTEPLDRLREAVRRIVE